MTRVFLKLYLLLILPLVLMTMLPQSPLNLLGEWWFEKQAYREYGAIYPLVNEELNLIPQSEWVARVELISKHFAYPLFLKKRNETKLKQKVFEKLDKKGYALISHNHNNTLVFPVGDSNYILYASLYSRTTRREEFEKDTRGYRYFLNKKIKQFEDPVKEFDRSIKNYFSIELKMHTLDKFKEIHGNSKLIPSLMEKQLLVDYERSDKAYLLSDDKKYVVTITNGNTRATYRRYYDLLSFIVPALLLAIGAFIWMSLYKAEFKKVTKVAKTFGNGDFDTRIQLSKNSALYPISDSFNNMAGRIQSLIDGQRELTNAVSHELKTPLSRLHYALELQKTSKTDEERKKYTNNIESNITVLETLVGELLTYTRLQTTQVLDFRTHRVKTWLEKELDSFAEYHPNVKIRLKCNDLNESIFDELMLSRALNNLLENAAYSANKYHPKINITSMIENNKTIILIEDNGTGIKESDREKIFEPFTRLDTSRQRHKKSKALGGYGIGLSIVQRVMLQHKGEVYCSDSNLGGAKFTLTWEAMSE